jgi:uncharacterized repeat protein (TIGR01451 family)
MALVHAAPTAPIGEQALPGHVSYFAGQDPAQWQTGIPTYAAVRYPGVYPGIDLIYHGAQGQLEYDFVVAPGADPDTILLAFEGVDELEIDSAGDLRLHGPEWALRQRKPVLYQDLAGVRQEIAGRYVRRGAHQVGFAVGPYDASQPLVIDPVLGYSTYLGGTGDDFNHGIWIAVDATGNAYVTGLTNSADFPTTPGAFQTALSGALDAFVTKLNPTGTALVYSTYLGGPSIANGIAVDSAGNAYVTGLAGKDFPTTPGAFQTVPHGTDAFVTKLNPTGTALVYSTYLGGTSRGAPFDLGDDGTGIAVDTAGNAYVTGLTGSGDFPTTPSAFQPACRGGSVQTAPYDAFVTKLNPTGTALVYSTCLGSNVDPGFGLQMAVDAVGNAYVTGATSSPNFPTTPGAFQPTFGGGTLGGGDAFVTKLNPTGTALVYSTYLGGTDNDTGSGICVDTAGNAYVAGFTHSTNFPTTPGAFQTTRSGVVAAFVTKLNPTGTALVYSTYLGGTGGDAGVSIAVDTAGNAYVTGTTDSADFPTTLGAFQTARSGVSNAFVTKLNPTGTALVYSTYLGGTRSDGGSGIAVDTAGNAYVTGGTNSANFPITPGAVQPAFGGGTLCSDRNLGVIPCPDGFVAKLVETADLALTKTATANLTVSGAPLTYTLTVTNGGPEDAANVTVTDPLPTGVALGSATASQGACAATSGTVTCSLGSLANGASATILLRVTVTAPAPGTVRNTASVSSSRIDPNPANNAATASTIVAAPCAPRPDVGVAVQPGGGGLQVTIRANTTAGTPSNALQALRFAAGTNTLLDLPGGPSGVTGALTVPLPAGTTETTFVGRQAVPGQAATLPLVVVDGCGDWSTFVGGGPSGFPPPSSGGPAGGASPITPSPSPTAGPTAAPHSTACTPRPPVAVASAADGPGRLRVTVSAGTTSALPTNALHTLRFGAASNALLDAGDQLGAHGDFTVTLAPGTTQTSFVVRRAISGQDTTVPLVVTDACGEWPTTVGGGAAAF